MTVHQCPKCELRFDRATELDNHCREEHPQFHHDYPVRGVRHNDPEPVNPAVRDAPSASS